MMTDDQIISVVQAHKEGKKIQVRSRVDLSTWIECENPAWAFDNLDYRVAPEPRKPREWNIILNPETGNVKWGFMYDEGFSGGVHVREIIE